MSINIDLKNTKVEQDNILAFSNDVLKIHNKLEKEKQEDKNMLGWMEYPSTIDKDLVKKIKKVAKKINEESEVLVVIGIGGSYLGSRAVIEALSSSFGKRKGFVEVVYAGNNLSSNYLVELIDYLQDKDFSINVISKSGTTTEPAIAFRMLREVLENKYGIAEARDRIYATTDGKNGALKKLSQSEGYETFEIPNNIGGRFSVLTPVGLLPIACAGFDIDKLLEGARVSQDKYDDKDLKFNTCYKYAVVRNILYNNDKNVEIFVNYEPKTHMLTEWLKQLFGESEGKDKKGILPYGADNTTDLHSLGQYIQDGRRNLFETVIEVKNPNEDIEIINDEDNLDNLNYLTGKTLDYVNKKALEGTIMAHVEGDVPNIKITIDKLDEYNLGELIYFFEKAVAMSGNLLEVNPFDQPGVEFYKKNMFKLLEKPGSV